jgi:hypothetical protein
MLKFGKHYRIKYGTIPMKSGIPIRLEKRRFYFRPYSDNLHPGFRPNSGFSENTETGR